MTRPLPSAKGWILTNHAWTLIATSISWSSEVLRYSNTFSTNGSIPNGDASTTSALLEIYAAFFSPSSWTRRGILCHQKLMNFSQMSRTKITARQATSNHIYNAGQSFCVSPSLHKFVHRPSRTKKAAYSYLCLT